MKDNQRFNMGFRPETYWNEEQVRLANIKGSYRRRDILEGGIDSVPPALRANDIGARLKNIMGAMAPHLRSGEDLPDYLDGEVEIARLRHAKTVHQEVISVRARLDEDTDIIRYRCVSEHEGMTFSLRVETSRKPLTLRRMIRLIETTEYEELEASGGLVFAELESQFDTGLSLNELRGFIEVSSLFYPQLGDWYDLAIDAWLNVLMEELEEQEQAFDRCEES